MKAKIKTLIITSLSITLFLGPIRAILNSPENAFLFLENFSAKSFALLFSGAISFLLYALSAYFVLLFFYKKKRNIELVLYFLLMTIPLILTRYFLQEILLDAIWGFTNYRRGVELSYYIIDNLYYAVLYYGVGIAYFFFQYSVYSERQKKELELQNKQTELTFLRSQVNPHFLFNVFNNLYALVNRKSGKALPVLDKLTSMLRYSLYENRATVSIETELNYINDFIELEQLRHAKPLAIEKHIDLESAAAEVPPFLLIPFIENAFKHGDVSSFDQPLRIELRQAAAQLRLEVENAKKVAEKDSSGGIGLENTRKRLAHLFPNKHQLEITETDTAFRVELCLELAP